MFVVVFVQILLSHRLSLHVTPYLHDLRLLFIEYFFTPSRLCVSLPIRLLQGCLCELRPLLPRAHYSCLRTAVTHR